MPELPEVETVRRQLDCNIVGKTIAGVEIFNPKSFIGDPNDIIGKKITGTGRVGKMLVINLTGDLALGIHLKMSGQLLLKRFTNYDLRFTNQHFRVIIKFSDKDELLFVDQRKFGWVKVIKSAKLKVQSLKDRIGKEPWDISDREFFEKLKKKSKAIKTVLTDQDVISGVGNIYACDGLWMAGIKPERKAKTLRLKEVKAIRQALIAVLEEGIKHGGSTGNDGKYVHVNGDSGKYQNHFKVYDRAGSPCLRDDGGIIKKIKLGGRGTYYCPVCQK